MKKLLISGLLITTFTLTGCTDAPITDQSAQNTAITSKQVCSSINTKTATNIIGTTLKKEEMEGLDSQTGGCTIFNSSDEKLNTRNFNIIVRITTDEKTAKEEFNRAKDVWLNSEASKRKTENLQGIGTAAFWAYGSETTQIISYKEKTLIILTLGHLKIDESALKETAKSIITKTFNSIT